MSGPCADCGGPDYQTLLARIVDLDAEVQHQVERREEEKLRAVNAEAALAESNGMYKAAMALWTAETEGRRKVEAALAERTTQRDEANTAAITQRRSFEKALAERDRTLRLAWFWHDRSPQHETFDAFLADLRARAEEGSG